MKYFPLLWVGLWRKRTRTTFTILSVVTSARRQARRLRRADRLR